MKFDLKTIEALSAKAVAAADRAEAAEQVAADSALGTLRGATEAQWREYAEAKARAATPAAWARKRRAVANGMARAFWARLARYRAMRALQVYAD